MSDEIMVRWVTKGSWVPTKAFTKSIKSGMPFKVVGIMNLVLKLLGGVKWVGASNICEECMALDGEEMTLDEFYSIYPVHPNCQCTYEIISFEEEE